MEKQYTEDDLLNYIYKETTAEQNEAIEQAISNNDELRAAYLELLDGIDLINKTYSRPSEASLDNIIKLAKNKLQQNVDE